MPSETMSRPAVAGPLFGWAIAGSILLTSLLMMWPTTFVGTALTFNDSFFYVATGETALQRAETMLGNLGGQDGSLSETAAAASGEVPDQAKVRRSYVYAALAALSATTVPAGGLPLIALQSLVITLFMALLVDRDMLDRPGAVAGAVLLLAGFTSLPFFISWLMPDILMAVLLLNAMLAIKGPDRLSPVELGFCVLASSFAVASHHGHLPVAIAIAGFVALLLLVRRRLTATALLLVGAPVVLGMLASVSLSVAAFNEVSVAPKRLPILLARSMADGPARWYLEEACPEAGYALCDRIDELPRDLGGILWDEEGLIKGSSTAEMDRIRAEEPRILLRAFLAYPLEQSWSLAGNTVRQIFAIGLEELHWAPLRRGADGTWWGQLPDDPDRRGIDRLASVQLVVVVASALYLGWHFATRRLEARRREVDLLLVLAAGMVANALVFGGLSAPAERYQTRLVWMVPMLAALVWLAPRPAASRNQS